MISCITIYFFAITIAIQGTSQVLSIDSIRRELNIPKNDTAMVFTFGWLSFQLGMRDQYDSSLYYAQKALDLSERVGYEKGKGYAAILFGNYYHHFSDYSKAIQYYSEARRIMEKLGDKQFLAIANANLGIIYTTLSEKVDGLDHLFVALKNYEEINDHTGAANALRHIGRYYDLNNNTVKALEYYFASLKKTDKSGNAIASITHQAIAAIYSSQENFPVAKEHLLKAIEANRSSGLRSDMAQNHNTIATIYLAETNYNEALNHINTAVKVYEELGDNAPSWGLPWCYVLIGAVYEAKGDVSQEAVLRKENYENAERNYLTAVEYAKKPNSTYLPNVNRPLGKFYYKQKKYQLARYYLENGIDSSSKYDQMETTQWTSLILSQLDSAEGNYKGALHHYKLYILNRDSLVSQDLKSKSEGLKMKYEFDKKEDSLKQKQIFTQARLDTQKKQKNYYLAGAILLALLSVFVFLNFRNQKKINRLAVDAHAKEKAELELQSLRAQLNPHFMFNSLNAIQELILKEENEKSQSYLARFAKLLRMLLENADKPFIPLQREIDFLQLYLALENLRIPDLQFSIVVDPNIDTEKTHIPNMILQPYIENAIWHGLSHKKNDKQLRIRISQSNGITNYEIEDNGVGRKKSAELKSLYRKEHKSKGMELLSKRFKLLAKEYGSDIETKISDVTNNIDITGTLVRINVPILLK